MTAEPDTGTPRDFWASVLRHPSRQQPVSADETETAPAETVAHATTDFAGHVEIGRGRPALTPEQRDQLGLGHLNHDRPGYAPRDPDYAQAQHIAASQSSVGPAPVTTASIVQPRKA